MEQTPATPPQPSRSRRKIIFILVAAFVSLTALAFFGFGIKVRSRATTEPGTSEQQRAVVKAATAFLAVLDAGDYERAWSETSPVLRGHSSESKWLLMLRGSHAALGANKERRVTGIGFTRSIEGAPDGEYCAVAFDSTYATTALREQITLHADEGQWKVAGYHLKKTIARF